MSPKRKWLLVGGAGASLFGFGLCAVVESGFLKHGDSKWWHWAGLGTLSLIVTIIGLVLLIKAGLMEKNLD
ncbi:MAG: hypothetical protein AAGC45_04580 [Bacteroidota bacterium]